MQKRNHIKDLEQELKARFPFVSVYNIRMSDYLNIQADFDSRNMEDSEKDRVNATIEKYEDIIRNSCVTCDASASITYSINGGPKQRLIPYCTDHKPKDRLFL